MELAQVLERNTAKIFSKIQKHLDLISKVETTLTKIKRKQTQNSAKLSLNEMIPDPINLDINAGDFACITKYLVFNVEMRDYCRESNDTIYLEQMKMYVPAFIVVSNETAYALEMRLTSQGLKLSEIIDCLNAIGKEQKVHVRRSGKKRLFSKASLQRSPSMDEEISRTHSIAE